MATSTIFFSPRYNVGEKVSGGTVAIYKDASMQEYVPLWKFADLKIGEDMSGSISNPVPIDNNGIVSSPIFYDSGAYPSAYYVLRDALGAVIRNGFVMPQSWQVETDGTPPYVPPPTPINDGKLTISQNGTTLGEFTANQAENISIEIPESGGGGGVDENEVKQIVENFLNAGQHISIYNNGGNLVIQANNNAGLRLFKRNIDEADGYDEVYYPAADYLVHIGVPLNLYFYYLPYDVSSDFPLIIHGNLRVCEFVSDRIMGIGDKIVYEGNAVIDDVDGSSNMYRVSLKGTVLSRKMKYISGVEYKIVYIAVSSIDWTRNEVYILNQPVLPFTYNIPNYVAILDVTNATTNFIINTYMKYGDELTIRVKDFFNNSIIIRQVGRLANNTEYTISVNKSGCGYPPMTVLKIMLTTSGFKLTQYLDIWNAYD